MIYLVDLAKYNIAFRVISNSSNKDDVHLVLIQDGVFINPEEFPVKKVYALKDDIQERGMESSLDKKVEIIDYGKFIELIEKYPVKSFV
ncbi:MAG: DsrH/TusB family sulfur relay protein [Candidatus Hodarchaeales archaeon]